MHGRTKRTPETREKFLDALASTGNVTESCAIADLARRSAYEWRDDDPDFATDWDKALILGTDALEDEAVRRGKDGTVKPVFYQGRECGGIREYSDTLLMFMLKARRPERFRESQQANDGAEGKIILVDNSPDAEDPK